VQQGVRVLAARDGDEDPVPVGDELIIRDGSAQVAQEALFQAGFFIHGTPILTGEL
jgi:hypothetical protein